jgi:hypothetical protein
MEREWSSRGERKEDIEVFWGIKGSQSELREEIEVFWGVSPQTPPGLASLGAFFV